jgi:hypothetical protein
MARIAGTERTTPCQVFTVDLRKPELTNDSRHIAADLNSISDQTIDKILVLTSGRKFEEITLDYCWCENAYYADRIRASFFHNSLPLLSNLLTDTGSIFLPSIPWFILKTYEARVGLRGIFKNMEFLDMETAGEVVAIVKGHDSISATEMEDLGKGANQLEKICATMVSVKSQVASTSAANERRCLETFVTSILQGRPLESIKLIRLQLDVV